MGSQTLEILRQGFWASFTGGWFFDPHQEIFCNTFHLYLWMYLLLLPFVTHLTTGSSIIPLIIYPCVIFMTFTILKYVNYYLHQVFDTGEIKVDVDISKKDINPIVDDTSDALKSERINLDTEPNESIEMKVLNRTSLQDDGSVDTKSGMACALSEPGTPTISQTEVNDHITTEDTKGESNDTESDNNENGQPEIVVVDVHKDTVIFSKSEDQQSNSQPQETGQESPLSSNSESMLPPLKSETPVHASDAVIANQGVISDMKLKLYSNDSLSLVRPPSPFPLCLRRLIDTSSDSSWSSSTGSSGNIFEDAKETPVILDVSQVSNPSNAGESEVATSAPEPLVVSAAALLDEFDKRYNNFASNIENFKSENVLTTSGKDEAAGANGNKAVSLSALQQKNEDTEEPTDKFTGTGARPKTSQAVWFSLPEMEKSADELGIPVKKDDGSSTDVVSGESSDNMANKYNASGNEAETCRSLDENDEESKIDLQKKSDAESDTGPDLKSELLGSLERRAIRRRGAIRPTVASQRERVSIRQRRQRTTSDSGGFPLLSAEDELCNSLPPALKHLALSHDDTTAGAVHCFQDEFGQWHTYMFGDEQMEVQPSTAPFTDSSIYSSSLLRDIRLRELLRNSRRGRHDLSTPSIIDNELEFERMCTEIQEFRRRHFHLNDIVSLPNSDSIQSQSAGILKIQDPEEPVKHHYKVPVIGRYSFKISFDRLFLLALMDRDKSLFETAATVLLATVTAVLGYMLLSRQYVFDFWVFVLCFVIAKCQFSLIKSVQPDSASPIHGHNNIITFSRSIYFCIVGWLILAFDEAAKLNPDSPEIYGVQMYSKENLEFARDMLMTFLLAFPVIFLMGWLPQITTFIMYFLEQIDIHLFGGTAMTGLPSAVYAVFRSVVSVAFLYGFAFLSLQNEAKGQHVLFSVFCGLLVAVSYHLSRCSSDAVVLWGLIVKYLRRNKSGDEEEEEEVHDPLPEKLATTVQGRICHDLIACFGIIVVVFAVHVSTAFTVLQPTLSYVLYILTGIVGILNHYIFPQLKKQLPWSLKSSPVLKSGEYHLFEARGPAKIMWFEQTYAWLYCIEKNILYPVTFLSALTTSASDLTNKFGEYSGPLIITICGLKLLRQSFSNTPRQYLILIWTVLFFNYDFRGSSETLPVDYFIMSIFVDKALDLHLKFCFIFTYTAPWQITWGSAFHAFAQPFSVPHCGMLFLQAVVSAFFSAPLNPFLGSAIFITSYVRPIKFWEKNYNTKRVDHSNTKLSTHLDSNPGLDDNNLNSIFYEHLTRSLQHSLCGDLMLGRWGSVASGDCFVMASDYLNALVHIIEIGNGLVTFQLRGLEFRGTYCQQREVEAITESVEDDRGCCCFHPGHVPNMLSFNTTFNQRWLAWEVVQSKYILEGYSISDNTATSMFQVFDLRKIFITYYVKAIIFYTVKSPKLPVWINDETLITHLAEMKKPNFVDLDATFRPMTDEDYDIRLGGVSRVSFCSTYQSWIKYCNQGRKESIEDDSETSDLVTLCFALSLLGRRLFSTASHQQTATLKSFLYGLHALFKGDFRVTSAKDEWVFAEPDMELLRKVIAPAVRMSVKLHQDHFTCPDEYDDNVVLYDSISNHEENLVISHEGHPIWRQAVLNNRPSLLALRYVMDEGTDDYKIIMLNKRHLSFRVIKVNRECVRGLWAGQLQELIFLRNRNPERGSIQNAKQALRNMINSSLDQPIGYPIYVSPLTTSYADTNSQFRGIIGGPFSSKGVQRFLSNLLQRLRERYGHTCQSGSGHTNSDTDSPGVQAATPTDRASTGTGSRVTKATTSHLHRGSSFRTSYSAVPSTSRRSSTSTTGAVVACNLPSPAVVPISENVLKARIKDISQVLDSVNVRNAVDLEWPSDDLIEKSGKNGWGHWYPQNGLEGTVVHRWEPNHPNPVKRSHLDRAVYLLNVGEHYIPVVENGVQILNEVDV